MMISGAFTDGYFVGGRPRYTIYERQTYRLEMSTEPGSAIAHKHPLDITNNEFAINAESDFDWQII